MSRLKSRCLGTIYRDKWQFSTEKTAVVESFFTHSSQSRMGESNQKMFNSFEKAPKGKTLKFFWQQNVSWLTSWDELKCARTLHFAQNILGPTVKVSKILVIFRFVMQYGMRSIWNVGLMRDLLIKAISTCVCKVATKFTHSETSFITLCINASQSVLTLIFSTFSYHNTFY